MRRPSHDVDTGCGTGFMRLSGGCVFASSGDLAIRQSSYSPYHAGPAAPRLIRLNTIAAFLACYCSLHLSDPGEPSDPGTSLRVPPGCTGDTTRRLVAHYEHPPSTHGFRQRGHRRAQVVADGPCPKPHRNWPRLVRAMTSTVSRLFRSGPDQRSFEVSQVSAAR